VQLPFRNPPHRLSSGRLVHVVHVLEGNTKPHGVFDGERWIFPKRTDGGNDLLSYEEIRDGFRDQRAFRTALLTVKHEADRMARHAEDINRQFYHPSAGTRDDLALMFRPALLESALSQVLGQLGGDEVLMQNLALLRGAATAADTEIAKLLSGRANMEPPVRLVLMVLNSARQVSAALERVLSAGRVT
jgi:hypothetical protein